MVQLVGFHYKHSASRVTESVSYIFYFKTCTVHLLLFCTMNQQMHN